MANPWNKTITCEDIAWVIVYDAWEMYMGSEVLRRNSKRKLRAMVEHRALANPLCRDPNVKAYVEEYLKHPPPSHLLDQ